ncbi:MAG: dihydroorotase [Cryomorphaceae bacterium]|nr:MAG: dihydroorotase [Cryomorphaceae bacterium]
MALLIKNARIINEGRSYTGHVWIEGQRIREVYEGDAPAGFKGEEYDASGHWLMPGLIDDQVHFREPGLTHKADLYTESRAAVAGGITSFMEMPNTVPNTLTQELLQAKYNLAAEKSVANYSFFMGAGNDNLAEVLKTDPQQVCGVKVFMGSSTGNMLVDNRETLKNLFAECKMLIATHCEDEATIRANTERFRHEHGEDIPFRWHPIIRSAEACYKSSSMAVELAEKYGTHLHILHISTARETGLFRNDIPLEEKKITAEACTHHLWFSDADYDTHGARIKWNPAVKTADDRAAVRQAVIDGRIDVLATDHAPHTIEEKGKTYFEAPAGGPLVQHGLLALLDLCHQGVFSPELIVQRACHAPAIRFAVKDRGFIRPGYFADLVLVKPNSPETVEAGKLLYKCGWSPFEGHTFRSKVAATFVNGEQVYNGVRVNDEVRGMRLSFNR